MQSNLPASVRETAQLPDFGNLGVLLRLLVGVNTLALVSVPANRLTTIIRHRSQEIVRFVMFLFPSFLKKLYIKNALFCVVRN